MRELIAVILALGIVLGVKYSSQADTVNPASMVTADSANTAHTIVYRDGSGNFSANAISAVSVIAAGGGVDLGPVTTGYLFARSDSTGTVFAVQEGNLSTGILQNNAFNLCISTTNNIDSYVYIAVATNTAQAVVGAACIK